MSKADYTFTYAVPQSAVEVYDAVTNVRGWWSQRIQGGHGSAG